MIRGRLLDRATGRVVVADVRATDGPFERMRGLLFRPPLEDGQGLLLERCRSIHTWLMGYALDVVYLDDALTVRKLVRALGPWRMSGCAGASRTLELRAGGIDAARITERQPLDWERT